MVMLNAYLSDCTVVNYSIIYFELKPIMAVYHVKRNLSRSVLRSKNGLAIGWLASQLTAE